MDVPAEDFVSVKTGKVYLEREKIMDTGIYYHSQDRTFDLVHVTRSNRDEITARSVIVRIPEDVAMEDPVGMYESALKQIEAFDERIKKQRKEAGL